jgi:CheY-like chemotaxis protein
VSTLDRPKLTIRFGTRSKLWADVVHALGERLYVETSSAHLLGDKVELEIFAPGLDLALHLEGTVVATQKTEGALKAGVFVRLAESSVARCREALNVPRNDDARLGGRAEPRAEGQLPARVIFPDVVPNATVRGLSSNGLTLTCSKPYAPKTHIELMVKAGGTELKVTGVVSWSRPELGLCGMQLLNVSPETVEKLLKSLSGDAAPQVRSATVVVADDEEEILELVSKVVKGAGHKVLTANRGDTALELIRHERPAMCFLDILMPGLDGLEVVRAMRADATLAKIPVILLSAMNELRLAEVSKAVGATGWLTKPMRITGVRAAMDKHLR